MIKNLNELLQWIGVISLNYLLLQEKKILPIIIVVLSLSILINLHYCKKKNLTVLLISSFIIYCTITFMNKTKTENFLTHCWYYDNTTQNCIIDKDPHRCEYSSKDLCEKSCSSCTLAPKIPENKIPQTVNINKYSPPQSTVGPEENDNENCKVNKKDSFADKLWHCKDTFMNTLFKKTNEINFNLQKYKKYIILLTVTIGSYLLLKIIINHRMKKTVPTINPVAIRTNPNLPSIQSQLYDNIDIPESIGKFEN